MSCPVSQSEPQPVSQVAGLFVPQALLYDVRLKPTERNAWMVFRSLADGHGVATVSHESLRTALLCSPGSQKAAPATVSRAVLCLRLTAWIEQNGCRRDPRTGFSLAASYTVRNEPLPFVEACLGSEDYLLLLERGLAHKHASVRELARDILDQAMNHPDELARLPFALQELVKRLHQRAYSSGNDSGGGSSPPDEPGLHISFTPSTFPKVTPKTPETVRTVSNKVYKVPTYRTPPKSKEEEKPAYRNPPAEMSDQEAMARFRRLAADQQDDLSDRLRALPVEQRRDVLAEWHVRCAAGAVRDAAAYLFGLIRKALQGTFRLWAAHKNTGRERPASKVRETPRETPKSMPSSGTSVAKPADKPASREVAAVYLQRMKAMLQGTANAAHPIRATKPPEHRPLVRAVAQAISQASQPRPLAAFLTPAMETAR